MRPGLFGLLLWFALPASASADLKDVKARGTLRVLVHLDTRRPEFFSVEPPQGFDREILEGFARLHGLKLEVVRVEGWGALVPALEQAKGDVIAGRFTATESRRKVVDFTVEVFPSRAVVLTRKPHPVVATLDELRRNRVGTSRGTSMAELIATLGMPPGGVDDGIPTGGYAEALRSGRVTAVVWGIESAIPTQHEDPEIQLGLFVGPPASLAYAVRKNSPELLRALNDHIESVRTGGSWSRLVVRYFGEAAPEILRKARQEK